MKCGECARFEKCDANQNGICHLNNGREYLGNPVSHRKHTYDKACKKFKEKQ